MEPEAPAKSEKSTAGPRSSIRRQRTIRGPHSRPSAEIRRRRMLGMLGEAEPIEDFEPVEPRQRPSNSDRIREDGRSIFEQERMRLRDTLSFERQHPPSNEIDGPFMPPVPESRDFSATEERQRDVRDNFRLRSLARQDLRRVARRRPAPTPPYTDTDLNFMARSGRGIDLPRPSSLTPARSPSHPSVGETDVSPRPNEDIDFSFTVRGPPYAEVSMQFFEWRRDYCFSAVVALIFVLQLLFAMVANLLPASISPSNSLGPCTSLESNLWQYGTIPTDAPPGSIGWTW